MLTREPDFATLPSDVPGWVRDLLRRCLERDPRKRLRDIGEARILLTDMPASSTDAPALHASRPQSARLRRETLAWLVAAAVVVAAGTAIWMMRHAPAASGEWSRFTQLTDQAGEETSPSVSPDGASIAFASRARGSWDIYVQRIGGRNPTVVAGDPARDESAPAYSPDGRQIAFHESDTDGGIFTVGATGESARRLTDVGFHPSWSPDGTQIVFCAEQIVVPYSRGTVSALWVVDVAGGASRKIFDGGAMNLWHVAIDESSGTPRGSPEPVTLGVEAAIAQPGFSRDGAKLIFRSTVQAINPAAMPFDPVTEQAGAPRLLFHRTAILVPTGVSRDGQWLALSNIGERQEDVFICRADGSDLTRLTDDDARDRRPVWSPDGAHLAFYSNRSGSYQIWVIGRDGGGLRQVPDARESDLLYPVYSPSGDRMVASTHTLNRPLRLFDPSRPWAGQQAAVVPLQLPPGSSVGLTDWSPDGRRLSGSSLNASGVAIGVSVYDVATRTLRSVGTDQVNLTAWLPDSRRVLASTPDGQLILHDVDSGRRRALPLPPGLRLSSQFVIAPDGRTIYVGVLERESNIWMVESSTAGAGR